MISRKIYIVSSYGGEYDDKWTKNEAAFTSKEAADSYVNERRNGKRFIEDDEYEEIRQYIAEKEYEMQNTFYDINTGKLFDGKSEEDYEEAYKEFEKTTKYQIIESEFGYTKEEFDWKEYSMDYDFTGYEVSELTLFGDFSLTLFGDFSEEDEISTDDENPERDFVGEVGTVTNGPVFISKLPFWQGMIESNGEFITFTVDTDGDDTFEEGEKFKVTCQKSTEDGLVIMAKPIEEER